MNPVPYLLLMSILPVASFIRIVSSVRTVTDVQLGVRHFAERFESADVKPIQSRFLATLIEEQNDSVDLLDLTTQGENICIAI